MVLAGEAVTLHASFVLLTPDGPSGLSAMLKASLADVWVASYQVGFGPPVVRSSPELIEELLGARSALEKLDIYLKHCFFDDSARIDLARRHRQDIVRRRGWVEAEALDSASENVWDLSLRLSTPAAAPPAVAERMAAHGVTALDLPPSTPPEALTGRLRLHLHDPRGERLLHVPVVAAAVEAAEAPMAVELRVEVSFRWVWQRWLVDFEERRPSIRVVDLGEPTSHARVSRDGTRG